MLYVCHSIFVYDRIVLYRALEASIDGKFLSKKSGRAHLIESYILDPGVRAVWFSSAYYTVYKINNNNMCNQRYYNNYYIL